MTDMDEGQAAIPGATGAADEQLIALLVPPPRPRRQVVFAVAVTAALMAGIVGVSAAGAVVPRLDVWIDHWTARGDSLTVAFRIRNQGSVDAKVRSLDARSVGLEGMRVRVPSARTVHAHHESEVSVHFDRFDCATVIGKSGTHDVRLRVTNSLGVTFTHTYPVKYYNVHVGDPGALSPDQGGYVLGTIDTNGWARAVTADACSRGR